jgi:hypothetical protein
VWIVEIDRGGEAKFGDTPEQTVGLLRGAGYRVCVLGWAGLSDLGEVIPDYENLIAIPAS